MKRDWRAFRAKVESEHNRCRICGQSPADAAHIIARSQVSAGPGEDPRNCLPLCRRHHTAYDLADPQTGRTIDLIPYLTNEEQAYAVELIGIERAYRRLVGGRGERPCSCTGDTGRSSDGPW
ncbi:MAG: HNH endonuclease [Betaproteobacteria bacterium]|nr:HNH endonuclease [Betaproteobacteria bacterium]